MKQLKDSIEDAQERETNAKNQTKELEAKVDIWGGEITTLQSRINVVQAEYEKILVRLKESEEKLETAVARTEESEVRRKQLAETEVDDFERSEEIENTLKAAAVSKENADHLVVEAERKVVVLERDLERVQEKYEKYMKRGDELAESLENFTDEMRELEEKDRDASERENDQEDKVKFLDTQFREMSSTAETHERNVTKLERLRDKLMDEIDIWNNKRDEVNRELEEMGALLSED